MLQRRSDSRRSRHVHYFSTEDAKAYFSRERGGCFKRVLLPFEQRNLSKQLFYLAVDAARSSTAELVLLQVNREQGQNDERAYSALRGLQAQVQRYSVPVTIATAVGQPAETIADYVDQHQVDLVMLTEDPALLEEEDTTEAITGKLRCTTFVIQAH